MGVLYKLCYISNQVTDEDDTFLTRLYQDLKREYFNGHSFENMFPSEKQKEQKPAWSEEDELMATSIIDVLKRFEHLGATDMKIDWLKNLLKFLRPAQCEDKKVLKQTIYKAAMHELAIKFMNYLDENRPAGKMGLSNAECEDIDKAFAEKDWAKIVCYINKYQPHWKPSEEQMGALAYAIQVLAPRAAKASEELENLREQLKKLM
jgi:hypothetical protein